ncbi:cobalamin biosynthesis protein [Methylobacterium planeticum]|uniref:Cobalamin biosynthesis protein n=1 Tax=Methylobacterium planeticum TaxID=2615211 RepID=A0A6N6MUV9_9HYPH|nr:cobalamin biosynthesis protein [Methylobacterium planeticum]KAB1075284.1 cobalamin biosynthesis protein [Methylobacterium planeticum]
MGLDQAVSVVAGIGFRRGTPAAEIVALLRRALREAASDDLGALATAADRADAPACREAARAFGLVPLGVAPAALAAVDARVPTRSPRIERLRGIGSLAEAAALAAAGDGARLILPRIASPGATCALARPGRDPEPRDPEPAEPHA